VQNRWTVVALWVGLSAIAPARADLNNRQAASNRAVSAINGELGLGWGETKFKGGDESTRMIRAEGNVPLGQAFGLNLSAQQSQAQQSFGSIDFDSDTEGYAIAAFWRNPQAGLLGYGRGRFRVTDVKVDGDTRTDLEVEVDSQRIVAAAYLDGATLSVLSGKTEAVSGPASDADVLWYHIVAYTSPDFLLDLAIGAQDADKNYSLAFEHQLTSVPSLSYGLTYSLFRNDPEATTWFLTINYRLGDVKPLVRRYHEDLFGVR